MATDKRIIKTRAAIKNAFMQLMTETEASKISVSDIAAKALVNRSTFYLHYADVNAVIKDIDGEIAAKIEECISDFDVDDVYGSTYAMLENISALLDEKEAFRNYLLFSKEAGGVMTRLKEIMVEKTTSAILAAHPNMPEADIVLPVTFTAAGLTHSYEAWIRSGKNMKPRDEFISELCDVTEYVIKKVIKR
ncbi:MAG: TetR/AcrR family transcriptional regulator [Clostridia bacterium]|nr:TetR/AcrR family transcriptional regulator [Clostridia bacterium]